MRYNSLIAGVVSLLLFSISLFKKMALSFLVCSNLTIFGIPHVSPIMLSGIGFKQVRLFGAPGNKALWRSVASRSDIAEVMDLVKYYLHL